MNSIRIEVMKSQEALRAFKATWRSAEVGEELPSRLAFGSLRELFSAITEKRLELIRYVATNEVVNVRRLAQALGRDYKNVYTDVHELLELGLLARDEQGALISPFDEIVIRAPVRDAA